MAGMSGKKSGLVAKRRNQRDLRRVLAPLALLVAVVISMAFMLPAISMTHGDLVCDMEEHAHSKACYEQVLVCGMEEGEGAQPATDDKPAVEGHKHTKACYEKQLTCDIPEHKHTDTCYAEAEPEPAKSADEDATSSGESGDESVSQDATVNDENAGQSSNQDTYTESQATDNQDEKGSLQEGESIESDSEDVPAQSFEATLKDADGKDVMTVNVTAPKGALPENAMMKIDGVDAKKVWEPVQGAAKRAAAKDAAMQKAMARASVTDDIALMTVVDIVFLDEAGNVVEPAKKLTVKIASDMVRDMPHPAHPFLARVTGDRNANDDAKRYADAEMVVKKVKVVNQDEKDLTEGAEDTLKFKADKFGPYAIMQLADAETADQGDADENEAEPVEQDESANQDGEAEPDEATNAAQIEGPAMAFEREVADADGNVVLKVAVDVPENTLPEGANMRATLVEDAAVIDAATEAAADDAGIDARHAKALAADITFVDADSNPIEPAGDVHVTMTAPIVAEQDQLAVVHVDDEANAQVVNSEDVDKHEQTVAFDASEFSVYALVYTVDFHWEVNGQTYEFSIPGGGFVTLAHVVQALGISSLDAQGVDGKKANENESESAEEGVDEGGSDAQESAEGIEGGDDVGEIEIVGKATAYEDAIRLNGENVSEDTWSFLADVERVEFSNPELAWVGNVGDETTVGALKEANELECEYSAELTVGQITEINEQTVEAGDWALISLKPFTSEETLTVTMKNGEVFVVNVTDAQYDGTAIAELNGATGALVNKTNNNAVLGIARNTTSLQAIAVTVNGNQITTTDGSPELTQWTFNYVGNWNGNDRYTIQCDDGYLHLGSGSATLSSSPQNLIVVTRQNDGETQIRIANDNHDALNNTANATANGYSTYNNWNYTTNPGEWFTVYGLTFSDDPLNLDGQTRAIVNNRDGGTNYQALRDEIDGVKDGRGYYVSGNATTYTSTDGIDYSNSTDIRWTFEFVSHDSSGAYYRIKTNNGYLFIDPDVTKKSDMPSNQTHQFEHALRLEPEAGDGTAADGTLIRIVPRSDGTYLLQNRNGVSLWNYGNNQFWLSTLTQDDENATAQRNSYFRFTQPLLPPHVTVHYVDRYGNVLTGVRYTGTNTDVIDNGDGTFVIPYNTSANVDLRSNFDFTKIGEDKLTYTYASTHLNGKDASGTELKQNGYVIDSGLIANSGGLQFKSDSGETNYNPNNNPPMGNLAYGSLTTFTLADRVNRRPGDNGSVLPYAITNNKDIYVILDPLPTGSSSGSPGSVDPGKVDEPTLSKGMTPNNDGTYTLSLKVDAHAKNASETNKANVLFVVDTSSSMRHPTTNGKNRIIDTHDAVLDLGQRLLAYNNDNPDAVQVSMLAFDGGVYDRLDWTTSSSDFTTTVNEYLRYYYMHQGTDWEDALDRALYKVQHAPDDDPTFVIFFTDGEPSQYTSFAGAGENTKTDYGDPLNNNSFAHEPVSGSYPNYYSYFLSRESSKDELRALVDEGAILYGIYAYNTTNQSYNGYNGPEDGAKMLHNAIKYGYNTTADLTNNLFYEAKNTTDLQGAFDKIFNLITEKVGFSNVVVKDGIASGVTSTTVVDGDVSAFTYIIRDKAGALAYKVTVAPHGVLDGESVPNGRPIFTLGDGTRAVGSIQPIPTKKIIVDNNGRPILDANGKIQTETVNVDAYYFKDANDNEYIMPIAVPAETVTWDLSPLGVLKDGYSYEVNFVVWPNQDSYDLVADLNNGKRPEIEATANWEGQPIQRDASGRAYRQGGFPGYPYISRYEDNGVYSAMSNTNQDVEFYKVDDKIVNGQSVTEITGPTTKPTPPPGPMPLTASYSQLEKQWNVERDRGIFAQYLYNTDGTSKQFKIEFDVFQGTDLTTPYKTVSLGWDPTANNGQGAYVWAPGDTMHNVTYAGHPHQIGTRWATDFSIATGLMLSSDRMDELGLNKSLYPSATYEGETYWILEVGHDYTIKEHIPTDAESGIGYEFDFSSPVYHPMLVDGKLQNVEITYTKDETTGKITEAEIGSMTNSSTGLSGIKVENTLRGYINLEKIVVDDFDNRVESDKTKFTYTVTLNSTTDPGPFEGDHIPWYGISGLFYHDAAGNYYQVYEDTNHVWKIKDESGAVYTVTSEGFDEDQVEAQTVVYQVGENQTKSVELFGNRMTATNDGKTATATLTITQFEMLNIANVPVGTTYTITESQADEYVLVSILKEIRNGNAIEEWELVPNLDERTATGTIVSNRDNHVTYKNKVLTGDLKITKTIQKNGSTDTSATGTFYYVIYDEPYNPDADPAQTPVRTGHIDVTQNGVGEFTEPDLKIGTYYVYELTEEDGTPIVSGEGGLYHDGKYYAVTTTGSPVTVELEQTSTPVAGIVNNYETTSVTATKTWEDLSTNTGHVHDPVFFKLYYRTVEGDVAVDVKLKELPTAAPYTVTWPEVAKYDDNGDEYVYIVKEYIRKEANTETGETAGEYEEDGKHYTEAAPIGYMNTEDGLHVTNTQSSGYDPRTTYSGTKIWDDAANSGATRPGVQKLPIKLYIDKGAEGPNPIDEDELVLGSDGLALQPDKVQSSTNPNAWAYTFHNLPVYDENSNLIRYYAVEETVDGYRLSDEVRTPTNYAYSNTYTGQAIDDDDSVEISSDIEYLPFVLVRKDNYYDRVSQTTKSYHIWTIRPVDATEQAELIRIFNQVYGNGSQVNAENTRFVSGLPMSKLEDQNGEFLYNPTNKPQSPNGPNGYKIRIFKTSGNTVMVGIDQRQQFPFKYVGALNYTYTAGSTDFTNTLKTEDYTVEKTWGANQDPPVGAEVVMKLKGTIPGTVTPENPNPAPVEVSLTTVGVTEKTNVTLNGGAEGGDDTTQDPWTYTWTNLPSYDKDGHKITYSVSEISYTIDGKTVDLTEFPPTTNTDTPNTTVLTNLIPHYSFSLLKVDAESKAYLQGARFTIQAIQPTSATGTVVKVGDSAASDPVETGSDGKASFNDIALGYYEIEETEMPAGYILLNDGVFYVKVDAQGVKLLEKVVTNDGLSFREVERDGEGEIRIGNVTLTFDVDDGTVNYVVENTPGVALPASGGPGEAPIAILGSALMAAASIFLVHRRRPTP